MTDYRVVYGESRPAWEKIFPSRAAARAFAKEHRSFGDVIFSIKKVVPGEPPQSMAAAIEAEQAERDNERAWERQCEAFHDGGSMAFETLQEKQIKAMRLK